MTTESVDYPDAGITSGMANPPDTRQPRLNRWCIAAVLGALAVLIVLARWHTYSEPLERDITTYAVIAHQILEGKLLYTELFDHKPPAVHTTYAAAELIAGYGRN